MKIVYGIKNCSTVKKVLDVLNANQVQYEFHDYKKLGVGEQTLKNWCEQVSWEVLVNKKGTTWRQLSEEEKESIIDQNAAIALMQQKTSVIKRPIIEEAGNILAIGFDEVAISKIS